MKKSITDEKTDLCIAFFCKQNRFSSACANNIVVIKWVDVYVFYFLSLR